MKIHHNGSIKFTTFKNETVVNDKSAQQNW